MTISKEEFKTLLNDLENALNHHHNISGHDATTFDEIDESVTQIVNAKQTLWDFVNPNKWHVMNDHLGSHKFYLAYGHYEKYGSGQRFATLTSDNECFDTMEDAQEYANELNAL